jgi:dihydroorotate dehydrogenase
MPNPYDSLIDQTIHHEYTTSLGDFFLWFLNRTIPSSEVRNDYLSAFAKLKCLPLLKGKAFPELEKTLKFRDNSLPLIINSPIMLAAGGNKYAANLPNFAALGFGGITVGSATKNPCSGNPYHPRLHMLPLDRAINNSMGMNNPGIDVIAHSVDLALGLCHKQKMAVGISIAETPGVLKNEDMIADLLDTFRKAYRTADYVEINVSSPNSGDGRIDWEKEFLETLLFEIMKIRKTLAPRKAVFVKLSPDMSQTFLESILEIVTNAGVTGLILFNTFPAEKAKFLKMKTAEIQIIPVTQDNRRGGISGRILYQNTLPAIKFIKKNFPELHLIAAGGIDHGAKILDLLESGADAVQSYTVLAYRWNAIHKMNKELVNAMDQKGIKTLDNLH